MSKVINLEEKIKKKEKKRMIIYILLALMIVYIIITVSLIIKIPKDTVIVDRGSLAYEENFTGYIVRDETVVKGKKYKNGIYQMVFEGEKAAKNQAIFRYYGENEKKIEEEIEKINTKIQKAMEKQTNFFSSDIKNIEEQIEQKTKEINQINDVQKIAEIKKEINDLLTKKAIIAGELSPKGSYIKKLVAKKEKYEKKITNNSEVVKAPRSGVVSYRVDGIEDVLTPKNFESITNKQLEELDLKTGKIVSTNNECAKIIDNFGCYIVSTLNSSAAKNAQEGENVKITLASGKEIDAKVYYKKEENDKILVVFRINTLTEELISYRKISCNITWWSYSGLKVPNDAIIEDNDGLKYVEKKTPNGTSKILIKVLKTNNKYSIISKYSKEDLEILGKDIKQYEDINMYDTIMLYPNKQ